MCRQFVLIVSFDGKKPEVAKMGTRDEIEQEARELNADTPLSGISAMARPARDDGSKLLAVERYDDDGTPNIVFIGHPIEARARVDLERQTYRRRARVRRIEPVQLAYARG